MSASQHMSDKARKRLKSRYAKERRFRIYGLSAVLFAIASLGWLLVSLFATGLTAFQEHYVTLEAEMNASVFAPPDQRSLETLRIADYKSIVENAIEGEFPDVRTASEKGLLFALISESGATDHLRKRVVRNPDIIGSKIVMTVPTSDQVDQLLKGHIDRNVPEARRQINDQQILWLDNLIARGAIKKKFNSILFFNPDSRDPELAGIASAAVGSVMIVIIAFILALPIGVGAAIYLDEFAPRNRLRDWVEININNLAAVPSIIFGLLGLAVFINIFGFQRSIPLVGGMVLALRAFPTIVIATRAALRSVSPAMVDGALSLGASHVQAVFQQKVPQAMPGILTGSIVSMALVLGETAPLLMIGMVAFVTEIPTTVTDPATALPVQIFLWSESPERAWSERTAAAILILLAVLMTMNAVAIWLRTRLGKRR